MVIPEPRFYLKEVQSKTPTLIYFSAKYSINEHPQRVMLSTVDKILPAEWDFIRQRAITGRRNLENSEINLYLDKMVTCFKSIMRNLLVDDITPTAAVVKDKMEELLNRKVNLAEPVNTLYSFIEQYINESKNTKAYSTIQAYNSTFNRLKEFGVYSNKVFSFDDIILEWRASFIRFLQQRYNTSRNTEGKYIKNVKHFLSESSERGLHNNFAFRSKSFSKPLEEVHKIFLTKDEIQKIVDVDLSSDKLKDIIRDYFIIACLTSLRYSDFSRIRKEHIQNNRIKMITQKTGQEVVIPIAPLVRNIFEKYDYNMPEAPCNQVFNRYLKEIGKMAELTEEVSITKTNGGIKKTIVHPKYDLLTTHCGRRTMISNCVLEGINSNAVMLISGHKSHRVFSSYVRISQQQNADVLSAHPFFN